MSTINLHRRRLLQLLVLVFGMNASLGYGACCLAMLDGVDDAAPVLVSQLEDVPPCHKQQSAEPAPAMADQGPSTSVVAHPIPSNSDTCCSSCVIGMPNFEPVYIGPAFSQPRYVAPHSFYISSAVAPLFRPPIFQLS